MTIDFLADMSTMLKTFCDTNGLLYESADELLCMLYEEEPRREDLCQWLDDYIKAWDAAT
jgi:hypothetical protein